MIKNTPDAVNKIQWAKEATSETPEFEITIKKDGELVYYNKGYSGVVNIVQGKVGISEDGLDLEGDSQAFGFGKPLEQLFAFDQLRKKLMPTIEKIQKSIIRKE